MSNHLFEGLGLRSHPADRPFVVQEAECRGWTYADVLEHSARLAGALVSAGVRPGDRVVVKVDKSVEGLMLYLASIRAGAIFVPLNPAYTDAEVEYFVADAEPRLLVTSPAAAAGVGAIAETHGAAMLTLDDAAGGSLIDAAAREAPDFTDVPRRADDVAAILYTSGTTGRSKGAMLSHGNLLSNALALREAWRFTAADRLIHALPIFHTHGLFVATNTLLTAGASMYFLPKFDASRILALMRSATCLMGVPTFYVRLLQQPGLDAAAASAMRLFVSGSAPLLAETHRNFRERTGHSILERYGMTETSMNTSNPYDDDRIPGSVGFPLPGVELRIAAVDTGEILPPGETGMIEVRGPNVCRGYWRMEDKTREAFREDGFFITGDLGRVDGRGYVYIVGRDKDMVISGGFNIYPKEIESELDQCPGVEESAVIGVPHPDFGEGVAAIVVLKSGEQVSENAILSRLDGRLARYKQPKSIVFVDELPRNVMGKVQKNVLRDAYRDLFAAKAGT
jgi:malonyl-CoA/methylmalonyl-CoA synthetase